MKLRNLKIEDAQLMLEWMHDEKVVAKLQTNFADKTLNDCINFIKASEEKNHNIHLAIADDNGEYMGTVSLKNIEGECAEFAITVRSCAMKKGYSKFAMEEIIRYGKEELKLKAVYWCVNPENIRAVAFYNKNSYKKIIISKNENIYNIVKEHYSDEQIKKYIWYCV